jgi:hypothetical protein
VKESLLAFACGADIQEIWGSRPGEILQRIHAWDGSCPGQDSSECGRSQSIDETLSNARLPARVCHRKHCSAHKLLTKTTPFEITVSDYIRSISSVVAPGNPLKRLSLGDILHTASSIRRYLDPQWRGGARRK